MKKYIILLFTNIDKMIIRNSIYKTPSFELVELHWLERDMLDMHDHPNKLCYFKVLEGQLLEVRNTGRVTLINKNDESYIDDFEGQHKVQSLTSYSKSIHLYINIASKL